MRGSHHEGSSYGITRAGPAQLVPLPIISSLREKGISWPSDLHPFAYDVSDFSLSNPVIFVIPHHSSSPTDHYRALCTRPTQKPTFYMPTPTMPLTPPPYFAGLEGSTVPFIFAVSCNPSPFFEIASPRSSCSIYHRLAPACLFTQT